MRKNPRHSEGIKRNERYVDRHGFDPIITQFPPWVYDQGNPNLFYEWRNLFHSRVYELEKNHFYNALWMDEDIRNKLRQEGFVNKDGTPHFPEFSFNHQGYRSSEFLDEEVIIALGCSDTFGTGQYVERLWHSYLAKDLNTKCYNLGTPGGSMEYNYLCLKMEASNFRKGTKIFWLVPGYNRMLLTGGDRLQNINSSWLEGPGKEEVNGGTKGGFTKEQFEAIKIFYLDYYNNVNKLTLQTQLLMDGVKNICNEHGFDLYYLPHPTYWGYKSLEEVEEIRSKFRGRAADNMHFGSAWQYDVYKKFKTLLK